MKNSDMRKIYDFILDFQSKYKVIFLAWKVTNKSVVITTYEGRKVFKIQDLLEGKQLI